MSKAGTLLVAVASALSITASGAFAPIAVPSLQTSRAGLPGRMQHAAFSKRPSAVLRMSEESESDAPPQTVTATEEPEELSAMDEATRLQMEKIKRAQELREQEVFIKRGTGRYVCGNCEWEYDEAKGDSMMIGGMIKPGTPFAELPSNWRCPRCRASKDSFSEVVEEIPGFAVNQGYGLGGNSLTSGQKSGLIFGGLFLFFLLFLSGYALS